MKIGIIGAGAVGTACAFAVVMRGCADELVLLDRNHARAGSSPISNMALRYHRPSG
jgi:malate/lactate dehydrogenase